MLGKIKWLVRELKREFDAASPSEQSTMLLILFLTLVYLLSVAVFFGLTSYWMFVADGGVTEERLWVSLLLYLITLVIGLLTFGTIVNWRKQMKEEQNGKSAE